MRNQILRAAVAELRERDESSFRVTIVAKQAGCATSVLYHYYGSREGLIDAALVAIAIEQTDDLRQFLEASSALVDSTEDAVTILVNYATLAHSPERRQNRALRARLLGAAQTRPAVRSALDEFSRLTNTANESLLRRLGDKGLIRTDVDISSLALLFRALDYAWIVEDLNDPPRVDFEAWIGFVRELANALASPVA